MTSKKSYQTRSALKDQKVKLSNDRRLGGDLVEFTESEEELAGTSTDQQLEWDHSVDLESPEKKEFHLAVRNLCDEIVDESHESVGEPERSVSVTVNLLECSDVNNITLDRRPFGRERFFGESGIKEDSLIDEVDVALEEMDEAT